MWAVLLLVPQQLERCDLGAGSWLSTMVGPSVCSILRGKEKLPERCPTCVNTKVEHCMNNIRLHLCNSQMHLQDSGFSVRVHPLLDTALGLSLCPKPHEIRFHRVSCGWTEISHTSRQINFVY